MTRSMMEFEVKVGEEEGPACLLAVQVLGCPEVLEVAVVSPDVPSLVPLQGSASTPLGLG